MSFVPSSYFHPKLVAQMAALPESHFLLLKCLLKEGHPIVEVFVGYLPYTIKSCCDLAVFSWDDPV